MESMAYPYVTDAINALLGTDIHLPIAMFGLWVAIAIVVAIRFTRWEVNGLLPATVCGSPHNRRRAAW
jgi:phosphatidylglycerol---prolipoprotein diacylglyceryl transferase